MSHSASDAGVAANAADVTVLTRGRAGVSRHGFLATARLVLAALSEGLAASHRYQVLRARGETPERAAAAALAEFSRRG